MAISLEEIRRRILTALFSDDELMDTLVLKGGNALTLVHKVGLRVSVDMGLLDGSTVSRSVDCILSHLLRPNYFRTLAQRVAVYAYSLEMIAAEKLRAICQQMPEYTVLRTKRPRARDFYDIHQVITQHGIDLTTNENRSSCSLPTIPADLADARV
jgi:predicted nucleotidyltransferase component of viral defense system